MTVTLGQGNGLIQNVDELIAALQSDGITDPTLSDIAGAVAQDFYPLNLDFVSGSGEFKPQHKNHELVVATGSGPVDVKASNAFIVAAGSDTTVTLSKSDRNDTVLAGPGNETIIDNSKHHNTIWTSPTGSDTVFAGPRDDVYGNGHSVIVGGRSPGSQDTIFAGDGGSGDTISLTEGNNVVYGGKNAHITAGSGQDTIGAGAGPETIDGGGHSEIYAGKNDHITTIGRDTVIGGANDTIDSKGGNATILVGKGDQTLNLSNKAEDSVFGGVASDPAKGVGTVSINENLASVAQTYFDPSKGTTTFAFQDGNKLTVAHVSVKFHDQTTPTNFV